MPSASQPSELLQLLERGELLLVPSDAAARRLRLLHDAAQQAAGLRVWKPGPVLSWDQWLQSLWSEAVVSGHEERLLLNAAQEHQLWHGIVANAEEAGRETLSSADTLAELAASAWRLAEACDATRQLRAFAATHDTRTFAAWAEEFQRSCQRGRYLSRASLEAALAEHITQRKITAPPALHITGFLRWTPAQEALLAALRSAGTGIETLANEVSPHDQDERSILRAGSEDEELRAAAVWIRRFLEQRDASAQVAVILPDLDADHDPVEAVFREVLAPELQLAGADLSSKPYEFAGGAPLVTHPMIAVALDLARWPSGPLSVNSASALLLSPYLNDATALDTAAQFDACSLRRAPMLRPEITHSWLLRLAQNSNFGSAARRWLEPMHTFLAKAGSLQAPRGFADWSEFIRRLVRSAGWPFPEPSPTPANSSEFHLAQAWDAALDTVATLDFSGRRVSYAEALHALERQLQSTPLARSTGLAPVQIMRPTDIAGMRFDALLFARATDTNWPAAERPNPLIDWKLQASLGMPGADRAAAADRSRLLTDAVLASAPTVLFTYAASNNEGPQRLSPTTARLSWPTHDAAEILAAAPPPAHIEAETFADSAPLPPLPSPNVHGGATVLQHQAACGFRAFAEVRLRAVSLETSETGFDARERGNLLHNAMSAFWNEVETQTALRNMSSEERDAVLTRSIDTAFGKRSQTDGGWDEAYVRLQKQRMKQLLGQWLQHELDRGPFTVLSTERSEQVSVGPLDLSVRIDRIDRIEQADDDGPVLLVDYKTGYAASPTGWLGERPDEPQLPLYALLPESGTVAGLAFAKVRPGDSMEWQGYASRDGILPGKKSAQDIAALLEDWHTHLTALATAFAEGDAGVRPKDYPVTCAHCGQRLLCRLDSATLLAVSDTDENAEEASPHG